MADAAQRILGLFARGEVSRGAWLDGGPGPDGRGVFGLDPDLELRADDLAVLDEVEAAWHRDRACAFIGFVSYECGVDALLGRTPPRRALPGVCLRRYPAVLELRGDTAMRGWGEPAALASLRARVGSAAPHVAGPWPLGELVPVVASADYRARVARAREHIAAGDAYQVNLSQPFVARWIDATRSVSRLAADTYATLRHGRPASMGALLPVDGSFVASNSPETLVDVRFGAGESGGDLVRMWPIKGTAARVCNPRSDAAAAASLLRSEKDRAEHVMIVDLVRNDLGRVCRPGSVRAPREPSVLTLPTVHHLVSEIRGTLSPGVGLQSLVRAVFPGGSITGAPKRRTCEIIEALEDHARGVYCGAIVLLEPRGLRLSIPIRTGWLDTAGLTLCAGGGIVIDSDPEAERRETELKTLAFGPGSALAS